MTNSTRLLAWPIALTLLASAFFIIIGAGCASGDETDVTPVVVEKVGTSGSFAGAEGSETEATMDALFMGYIQFATDNNLTPDAEGFSMWRQSNKVGDIKINDAYNNSVDMKQVDGGVMLWSEGADRLPDTADDYYKLYSL
jgi:hypothetical protein